MSATQRGGPIAAQSIPADGTQAAPVAGPEAGPICLRMRGLCAGHDPALFSGALEPEEQAALAGIAEIVTVTEHEAVIYVEGEQAEAAYLIVDGLVRLSRHDGDGLRHVIALMWPGDVAGLAEESCYVDSASALAPTTLYRFELAALRDLLLARPALQMRLLLKALHDLRAAERRIVMLSQESAQRRIAAFLADLCGLDALYNAKSGEIRLPLNRTDIADYLGLAVETVSRGIREIEDAGLLERRSPRLFRITNHDELVRLAQAVA